MISLRKRSQGFTIVELLIVIVVIGILALLVITTYSGIQAKARNAKRSSDVATIQTQLEAFFQNSGYYPSLTDMNDETAQTGWLAVNMKSLDTEALVDPSNATQSKTLDGSKTGVAKSYSYWVANSAGTSCESDDTTCSQYVLTATYEGKVNGSTIVQKTNLD